MADTTRPPAREQDNPAEDYTGTQRGFLAAIELRAAPDGLTTAQLADRLGLTWRGAWALMSRACGVREAAVSFIRLPGDDAGRWVIVTDDNRSILADGFEGNPPLR